MSTDVKALSRRPIPKGRLLGVDAVRALAIVGVFVEHFHATGWLHGGPPNQVPLVLKWLDEQASSRAMSLFVLLFGLSAALMTGGSTPYPGRDMTTARRRLAVRAGALFLISLCIDEFGSSVIEFYAVLLLLLLPLARLRARTLFCASAVAVPVVTLYAFWVINAHMDWMTIQTPTGLAVLTHPAQWGAELFSLVFVGGGFQTVYGIPLVLAGMAIGRLDLRSHLVRVRMTLVGLVLAVGSIVVSWVAMYPLGGADALMRTPPPGMPGQALLGMPTDGSLYATSPFGITLMIGVALVLLGGMLVLLDRAGWRRLLWPLAAAGSMALTWYATHFIVRNLVPGPYSFVFLVSAVVVMLVVSTGWRHWLRRGPLEWLVHRVITLAVPGPNGRGRAESDGSDRGHVRQR